MIKFFRQIRRKLLRQGKPQEYLFYAIGEIVLVVLGILIALQINNWNNNKQAEKREMKLLSELIINLETNIHNLEEDIYLQQKGAKCIDFLIDHLDHRRPYHDSLSNLFWVADFAPDVILTASAFETIKSVGLDIIKSDTLRKTIIHLFDVTYPYLFQETKRLEDQLWPAVVVPLYQKHFRSDAQRYIPNDYNQLLEDIEFVNMLSRRGVLRKESTLQKIRVTEETSRVIELIQSAISK